VLLVDDGLAPVAVRAPNLALRNLSLQDGDRALTISQLHDASCLSTDVVEVRHDRIGLGTDDAWVLAQVVP
jgi:hypothetical protein